MPASIAIHTDLQYGPEPRQLANVAHPQLNGSDVYPAVLYIQGGAWRSTTLGQPNNRYVGWDRVQEIARRFFVGVTIDFKQDGFSYPYNVDDILRAIEWIRAFNCVDGSRIILYGESSGAHLAALAAWRYRSVAAVAAVSGIYRLASSDHPFITDAINEMLGEPLTANPNLWSGASPIAYCTPGIPRTFIAANYPDELMPDYDTDEIYGYLVDSFADFSFYRVEGVDHAFQSDRAFVNDAVDKFLEMEKHAI